MTLNDDQWDISLENVLPKITVKQYECLAYIATFFRDNQYYPSRREIAAHMGITAAAVNQHISLLEKKGYLTVEAGERRNIRLNKTALQRLALDERKED
jgi:SOS-response transcriptional repressors (RecA-mediated autopeptidases)